MSSTPGRSDSQRSYTKGDDQISVRKISEDDLDVEGRKSGVGSSRSSSSSSLYSGDQGAHSLHDSCVLKHFSKHRSSHLRFLAWVAYTRRFTNDAITDLERRTCPLLWCREEFADQEAMLQHVWNCPHLSKGLYWCFHCRKPERLGKFHKRCTGIPSKTDRLANVAKRIFSKLGAGSHRKSSQASSSEGSFSVTNSWKSTDVKDPSLFRESPSWDYSNPIPEMPDTSIMSEMAADWTAACQELADTSVMEMVGNELSNSIGHDVDMFGQQETFYPVAFEDCAGPSSSPKPRSQTPKLPRLDTSMSPLYRGEWKYPVNHYPSNASSSRVPSLDDIVSPMSAIEPRNISTSFEVSPTETVASGASFFTDSGYTSATSYGDNSQPPSRVPSTKRTWECAAIPEEHLLIDQAVPVTFPVTLPDFEQTINDSMFTTPAVSRSSSNASEKSKAKILSPHWSDAQSLVQCFSEILDEHITHTKATLRELPTNSVTLELLAMSKSSVVSLGLDALHAILEGRHPTSIIQIFSFTHIACACAIAMNPDRDQIHSRDWFHDSTSWVSGLSSLRDRQLYTQVAAAVWQPPNSISQSRLLDQAIVPSSNQQLKACQHFLDILESYDKQDREAKAYQSFNSGFDFKQLTFELDATNRVIERLKSISTIEAFMADVVSVGDKLRTGRIKTVRELELDLVCAGRVSSQSHQAYDRFLDHVIKLCNDLYKDDTDSANSRIAHHIRDITLIKQYLPEDIYDDDPQPVADLDMSFDECFDFVGASAEGQTELNLDVTSTSFGQHSHVMTTLEQAAGTSLTPSQPLITALTPPVPTFQFNSPTPPVLMSSFSQTVTSSSGSTISSSLSNTPAQTSPLSNGASKQTQVYKCFCGYVPSGEERWKASNLRRHKRTQHPDPSSGTSKVYKCRWPGCKSVFTRSDNLRSHQRSRGHNDLASIGVDSGGSGGGDEGCGGRSGKKQRLDNGHDEGEGWS